MVGGGCGLKSLYHSASASSMLSLLMVTENQLSGGDSPLVSFPFKDSSP
jgi:hypothetical protein